MAPAIITRPLLVPGTDDCCTSAPLPQQHTRWCRCRPCPHRLVPWTRVHSHRLGNTFFLSLPLSPVRSLPALTRRYTRSSVSPAFVAKLLLIFRAQQLLSDCSYKFFLSCFKMTIKIYLLTKEFDIVSNYLINIHYYYFKHLDFLWSGSCQLSNVIKVSLKFPTLSCSRRSRISIPSGILTSHVAKPVRRWVCKMPGGRGR